MISLFIVGLASPLSAQTPAKPIKPTPTERVALWPGKAPVGDGKFEDCNLEVEVFLPPADKATGTAIVLCPGGGYIRHVTDREGYPIAQWLNEHGIATIILEYRLPKLRHQVPLLDAQRAIRLTRDNAAAWKVDPKRIGILGFSAGGHVASTAATHFDTATPIRPISSSDKVADPISPGSSIPSSRWANTRTPAPGWNFLALIRSPKLVRLPIPTKRRSPPTPRPRSSRMPLTTNPCRRKTAASFVAAMKARRVSVDCWNSPSGGHGLNGCKGPLWEQWKAAALKWTLSLRPKDD